MGKRKFSEHNIRGTLRPIAQRLRGQQMKGILGNRLGRTVPRRPKIPAVEQRESFIAANISGRRRRAKAVV